MNYNKIFLICLLSLVLTACPPPRGQYPAEVQGIGDSPAFPMSVAGFQRDKILTYNGGLTDISVGYNLWSAEAQIAATLYRTQSAPARNSLEQYFAAAKQDIAYVHKGAALQGEERMVLRHNGQQYNALRAQYQYEDVFARQRQAVYSELLVWEAGGMFLKMRMTAPIAQKDIAQRKNMELIGSIDWLLPVR